jgi:hypothetical protein
VSSGVQALSANATEVQSPETPPPIQITLRPKRFPRNLALHHSLVLRHRRSCDSLRLPNRKSPRFLPVPDSRSAPAHRRTRKAASGLPRIEKVPRSNPPGAFTRRSTSCLTVLTGCFSADGALLRREVSSSLCRTLVRCTTSALSFRRFASAAVGVVERPPSSCPQLVGGRRLCPASSKTRIVILKASGEDVRRISTSAIPPKPIA